MKRFVFAIMAASALAAAETPIMPSMNAFTVESYKHLAQGDSNLILSPFNIGTALSMLLAGARGQTATEIQATLHLHYDPSYDAALGALLADLNKAGNTGSNQLLTANGLWAQKSFAIQPDFEKTLAKNYQAPLTPVDFVGNSEAVRAKINNWTEEHTNRKIANLLPPGSLDAQTRLVVASAIYFYGKWQEPFLVARTQPAPFSVPGGAIANPNFMNQTSHLGYAETPSAQILEMGYAGTGIAFDVLLPKTTAGLPALEQSLTSEKLTGWLGTIASRNVQVSLPKFRAEASFDLSKTLSAMGMPTAFTGKADFTGMAAKGGLAISEIFHKAFVDVSEQGTEAAAATGGVMRATAVQISEPPVVFRADHPFLFLIRDTRTGVILFIGRLESPK